MGAKNKDVETASQAPPPQAIAGREECRPHSLRAALIQQFNPLGAVEQAVVDEIARRASQMREFDDARTAMRDQAASALANVLDSTGLDSPSFVKAGALASDRHESLLRQGLAASRGFYRALGALRVVQADRMDGWQQQVFRPDERFVTEQGCYTYLIRRHAAGQQPCRRCGQRGHGYFIAARLAWECGHCQSQTGLRVGTVMERSALPLTKWFAAIRAVLLRPAIAAAELAKNLGIDRVQTVRGMIEKIRQAVAAENASELLAGLDDAYLVCT
jgi:hypothetical protein